MLRKVHQKKGEGTKFIIKPLFELDNLGGSPSFMAKFYGKTLRFYKEHKFKGDEAKIKRLAKGLCIGLAHMHDCNVAHRDFKIDNILLQNAEGDPVIIDFGLTNCSQLGAGTRSYLAPEQI